MKRSHHSVITSFVKNEALSGESTINENFLENRDGGEMGLATGTVEDILNDVLRQDNFQLKQSGSLADELGAQKCSRAVAVKDDLSMDPRLLAWNTVLEQRRKLQKRIERETGKRPEDVLFNRPATVDETSKRMILRVLDTADRSRPLAQLHENFAMDSLKLRYDPQLCREIREVYASRPQLQPVEFVGLPQITQKELTVTAAESQWQRSEVLGQRIQAKKHSIQEVLEFVPDVEALQVVPAEVVAATNTAPIAKIGEDHLLDISGDSPEEDLDSEDEGDLMLQGEEEEEDGPAEKEVIKRTTALVKGQVEAADVDELQNAEGVLINGSLYDYRDMKGGTKKGIHLMLKCDPHQRVVKTLVDIQNLSQKFIHISWAARSRFRTDRQPMDCEMIFDRCEFILVPQQRRVIRVLFHPQQVGLITQRWSLCCVKSPFCGTRRLRVVIQGQGTMPDAFKRRLQNHRLVPLDKHQRLQADSILQMQGSLAPIIVNPPLLCPYRRTLDEREVFNSQNPSYRCGRYADLEALKDLYAEAKKPRDRPWDLQIESLRSSIGRQESRFLREQLYIRLLELLEPMKCNRCEALDRLEHNPERERACFIYVRGTISSAIDQWEKMALSLDDQFFKLEWLRQQAEQAARAEEEQEEEEEEPEMQTVENVSKKVRSNKYLKDALYMHTYTLLCDAAEDIVSVIESTCHL